MNTPTLTLSRRYHLLRQRNDTWRLLTAKRAPIILACAEQLFMSQNQTPTMDMAVQLLTNCFNEFIHDKELIDKDPRTLAKQEWRDWLKRGLIIERDNEVFATDALQKAIYFIKGLEDDTVMTSTASRLQTVQSEIEKAYIRLNPNQQEREQYLKKQIDLLHQELANVKNGDFELLDTHSSKEMLQNIYELAMSLYHDFRRVEDSYRQMDKELREKVIREQYHRGQVIHTLLDYHDELISTPEGRVFQGFNHALQHNHIDELNHQIKQLVAYSISQDSLTPTQLFNLSTLISSLNKEASQVIRAKQNMEKDVRSFIQTGLATEHHRVGDLLNQIFKEALNIDWQDNSIKHTPSHLPPIAIELNKIASIERFLIHEYKTDDNHQLNLDNQSIDLNSVDSSFWQALDGLDRQDWFDKTKALLSQSDKPLSIADLHQQLPIPDNYDLEAIALWIEMACRTSSIPDTYEYIILKRNTNHDELWQFKVPVIALQKHHFDELSLDDI
ncbi:DUF3375 family protein [Moraxella sp. K127]|uniref:DUF3375 family protein n=1 Tax=Moraxella sp. K127 TaxID=2780079 RepID=UPI00188091DC|nr:DUF3375 family protein [Moraxella sp. K127]MBE9589619.1 DUF3375 family protein [Moraxella sp. K127]